MDARVANSLQDSRSPAVQPGTQLHWTWPAAFDACGVARLAALSLSGARTKSSRPKAHVRPIHLSPGGKKGGQGKSPLLLDVRSPPPTVTYCTAYKAFPSGERNSRLFFSSSLFFTIDAIIPRLSLYKLESRWVYKILSVLVFFSFLFFETMENGEDSKDLETKDSKIPALPFLHIIPVDAE